MDKIKLTGLEKRWILYDVGNSAFTLLISTIIPIYFNDLAGRAGISEVDYLAYWGYAASLATAIVAVIGPVLGTIADTQNFGIVRMIVSDSQVDEALRALRGSGFTARVNNVVCAEVEDRPLGLNALLETIESIGVSVEYLYSFLRATGERALIILRLSEQDEAVKKLAEKGVKLVSQQEIDRL